MTGNSPPTTHISRAYFFAILFHLLLSSVSSVSSASTAGQSADEQRDSPPNGRGYSLVTPLSLDKESVESDFEELKTDIPGAEVRKVVKKEIFYRLVTGCFTDMPTAHRVRTDLRKMNINPFIMQKNNKYCVNISSHLSKQSALDEQKYLAKKNINATLLKLNLPTPHWQIRSVSTLGIREAVYTSSIITAKGIVTIIE